MPVILNFSNGSVLPENELEALRHIARSNQNDTITIGGRNMRLHYIQFMDGFSVEPILVDFGTILGQESLIISQTARQDNLTEVTLFCRHTAYIWSRGKLPRLCRKAS